MLEVDLRTGESMQVDTVFIVAQVFWDMFLILIASVIVSAVISYLAVCIFPEEKIESFLNKYGIWTVSLLQPIY